LRLELDVVAELPPVVGVEPERLGLADVVLGQPGIDRVNGQIGVGVPLDAFRASTARYPISKPERGTSELFRVSVAAGWTVRAQVLRLGCGVVGELFEGGAEDA
jgi:hypothetical protein